MIKQTYILLLEVQAQTAKDPLINWQGENIIKIGVIFIILVLTLLIRAISPRVEHAVIFALVSSLLAIAFFMFS